MQKTEIRPLRLMLTALACAAVFFAVTMPFRHMFRVMEVTEVRPASAFNPVFGLLFGFAGVLGCAVGNLAADAFSGYSPLLCVLGFLVQLIYGALPMLIWRAYGLERRLNTASSVTRYTLVMLLNAIITALLLGVAMALTGIGGVFTLTTLMIFLNNFVFCMILGIPILLADTRRRLFAAGKRFSLNEKLVFLFLTLALLSAVLIGFIAYSSLYHTISDNLDLWNRVYIAISVDLLIFFALIIGFLHYAEHHLTIPLERLEHMTHDYVDTRNERLETLSAMEECRRIAAVGGEVGALAEAFLYMSRDMESYIQNLTIMTAEKERISAELDVAQHIQASLLPRVFPAFPDRYEFDLHASMVPAREIGGDFYDFYLLDHEHLVLVMADVSGKGIPAALFMMITKTLLKGAVQEGLSPKAALEKVNRQLCENNEADMFVTVWLGILNISTGQMVCANAGHEHPVLGHQNDDFELVRERHGFVVGGMEGTSYSEYTLHLQAGDTLFLYTDGVPEATRDDGALYGIERMLATLNQAKQLNCRALLDEIHSDTSRFTEDAPQFDDITMLCLKINPLWTADAIRLSPEIQSIEKARDYVDGRLPNAGVPERVMAHLHIVMDEVISNIVLHGMAREISLSCQAGDQEVTLQFVDDGIAFDPMSKEEPYTALPLADRSPGGLGILMIRKLVDTVHYQRDGGHNFLTITKRWQ